MSLKPFAGTTAGGRTAGPRPCPSHDQASETWMRLWRLPPPSDDGLDAVADPTRPGCSVGTGSVLGRNGDDEEGVVVSLCYVVVDGDSCACLDMRVEGGCVACRAGAG